MAHQLKQTTQAQHPFVHLQIMYKAMNAQVRKNHKKENNKVQKLEIQLDFVIKCDLINCHQIVF